MAYHGRLQPRIQTERIVPKAMERPDRVLTPAQIDPEFMGQPVVVVGGGPSINGAYDKDGKEIFPPFDFKAIAGLPTIAVNSAFEEVPDAKYLLFADHRWFMWNEQKLKSSRHIPVTVGKSLFPNWYLPRIRRMVRCKDDGICHDRTQLAGIDSGCLAVNLAWHLGASRILLVGFDSGFDANGNSHYHKRHQTEANNMYYTDRYGPRLVGLCQRLRDLGVPVVRVTPPGMPEIPYVPLPEALTGPLPPVAPGLLSEFVP